MISQLTYRMLSLFVLTSTLFMSSCNQQPSAPARDAKVNGTVNLNGKPIGPFTVNLMSFMHGNIASGQVSKEGTFTIDTDVPTGEYSFYLTGPENGRAPSGIAQKYFSDTSTDQRFHLKAGENVITMDLK
ncbi:hypothetical protein [Planctomicrobium sp. SH527]|uniref:hypothetical protein n=1 Tax=Planctomicrobium sp. SH527 TaxID=3448123 RepID=UPI003F5B653B